MNAGGNVPFVSVAVYRKTSKCCQGCRSGVFPISMFAFLEEVLKDFPGSRRGKVWKKRGRVDKKNVRAVRVKKKGGERKNRNEGISEKRK